MKHNKEPGKHEKISDLKALRERLKEDGHHGPIRKLENLVAVGYHTYTAELKYSTGLINKKELQDALDTLERHQRVLLEECKLHKLTLANWQVELTPKALHDFFLNRRDEGYEASLKRHLGVT
ncbi:MAG: hypothetical protein WCJ59_01105 [bacterium]